MKKIEYIFILTVVLSCRREETQVALPFYNTPDFTPQWISKSDKAYASLHTIGLFSLLNQQGETITNKNVEGKIYVANFFFTACTSVCPRMMQNLKKVALHFARNDSVRFLSHTVLPEADSIARLKQYSRSLELNDKQWWLLTGNKDSIYTLARRSYFADEEIGFYKGSNDFLHTENCVLVDGKGRIRGVYNGTLALDMEKLIEHISLLEQEQKEKGFN